MKSFIESDFPIKEVSEESTREKNKKHRHVSTLHIFVLTKGGGYGILKSRYKPKNM